MRVEINLVLFFPNKEHKKIDAFLNVTEGADDKEVMDAMGDFIEGATEKYLETFTSGVAQMMVGSNELYHVSFQNPHKDLKDLEGAPICNIIVPENITIH